MGASNGGGPTEPDSPAPGPSTTAAWGDAGTTPDDRAVDSDDAPHGTADDNSHDDDNTHEGAKGADSYEDDGNERARSADAGDAATPTPGTEQGHTPPGASRPRTHLRRLDSAQIRQHVASWARNGQAALTPQVRRWCGFALLSGLGIVVGGCSPTGGVFTDLVLTTGAALFVIWAGRRAPRPVIAAAGLVAVALLPFGSAGHSRLVGVALGLTAAALVAPLIGRPSPWRTEAAIAVLMVSWSLLGDIGPLGLTALIGVAATALVVLAGLRASPAADARFARRVAIVALAGAGLATAVGGAFAWWARSDVNAARQSIETGVDAAGSADLSAAASSLHDAHRRFGHAHLKLANPLVWPARLVPGVAQNLRAASAGAGAASDFTGAVDDTIGLAVGGDDDDGVQISDGAIDLDSLNRLVEASAALPDDLDRFNNAAASADSPWLVPPLANGLHAVTKTAERQRPTLQRYADATQLLPGFLGADGARHYFVMFTTPAEARGQGGFMGNFAEITIDEGAISMDRFGRVNDLEGAMDDDLVLAAAPADWLARYGPYGFVTEPDGAVAEDAWAIINLSAHFPSTAEVIAEMYPRSGGHRLDGVFSLDVYGLEALVGLVGPIEVDGGPVLDGDNTAQFLLLDQYLLNPDGGADRVDMLSTIANEVVDRLLRDDPPSPGALASAWAPLGRERRLLAWSPHTDQQDWFTELGLSGAVLDPHYRQAKNGGPMRPAFQVVLNNGTGSKIDSFLRRDITVDGRQVTVELHNTAPPSGLDDYVIGTANDLDLPLGTSVSNFTVYASEPLSDFTLDGEPIDPPTGTEAGYHTYDMRFSMGPGARRTITFATTDADNVNLLQPLARTVDAGQPKP